MDGESAEIELVSDELVLILGRLLNPTTSSSRT